jgi:predicted DNA-binding transcriptional regulator AlpA
MHQSPLGTIFLHSITPEEFYDKLRAIIKQELQQDQLLTKEGALKMTGVSNATFMRAIQEGIIHPQLVKGRSKAMYLESEVLKIQKRKKPTEPHPPVR